MSDEMQADQVHQTVHVLRTNTHWYRRLLEGAKTCEVVRHDRDFQAGDRVRFRIAADLDSDGDVASDDADADSKWVITHVLLLSHVPDFEAGEWCVLSLARVIEPGDPDWQLPPSNRNQEWVTGLLVDLIEQLRQLHYSDDNVTCVGCRESWPCREESAAHRAEVQMRLDFSDD